MLQRILMVLIGVCLIAGFKAFLQRAIPRSPGILVASEPLQKNLDPSARPIKFKEDLFQLLATYSITARVLSKERYRFDHGASFAPWDLALGWKEMSDSSVLTSLNISQSNRFYWLSWQQQPPIPAERIFQFSANVHVIPANSGIESVLGKVRVGHVIHLRGYLVRLDGKDGSEWKSSLVRTDTGNGACELMYVEEAQIVL